MHAEFRVQRRFDHRQHHRHVFRQATGHDRVDRHFLDRAFLHVRRDDADDLVRLARGALQHAQDALVGRRHDRQPVGPAPAERLLDRVVPAGIGDLARLHRHLAVARLQQLMHAGFDTFRPAAGLVFRQPFAQPLDAGQFLPVFPVPAKCAFHFLPLLAANQGGHEFDVVMERLFQRCVIDHPGHAVGKIRVVLAIDGERHARILQALQHGRHQFTGRAIPFDDGDQAIRLTRHAASPVVLLPKHNPAAQRCEAKRAPACSRHGCGWNSHRMRRHGEKASLQEKMNADVFSGLQARSLSPN